MDNRFNGQGLYLGPIDPNAPVGNVIGQTKQTNIPEQAVIGTVEYTPPTGVGISGETEESMFFGLPCFLLPAKVSPLIGQPSVSGVSRVTQAYNVANAAFYTAERLGMIVQNWVSTIKNDIQSDAIYRSYNPNTQFALYVVKMDTSGIVILRTGIYNMQTDGSLIAQGQTVYVRIPTSANPIPIYMANAPVGTTPDPTVWVKSKYKIELVMTQNQSDPLLPVICKIQN